MQGVYIVKISDEHTEGEGEERSGRPGQGTLKCCHALRKLGKLEQRNQLRGSWLFGGHMAVQVTFNHRRTLPTVHDVQ